MKRVGGLKGLILVPVIALAATVAIAVALIAVDERLPDFFDAVVAAVAIVGWLFTWLVHNRPSMFFWNARLRAYLGKTAAPAWAVTFEMRSRLRPESMADVVDVLRGRGLVATVTGGRSFTVSIDGAPVVVEWVQAIDGREGIWDWQVSAQLNYPSVPYHETSAYLSGHLHPALHVLESALEVHQRHITLVVKYPDGSNPFEGILVRSAPSEAIASYHVVISLGDPSSRITVDRTSLRIESADPSAFLRETERLLTLDGTWPARFVSSLR